ncbi:MAG: NAD(+) diphosphatase [Pseudomonadota bacterium]
MSWPTAPNRFISLEHAPDPLPDRRCYFVWLEGRLLGQEEQGALRPLDGDAYRWLDIEVQYEHFLGLYDGAACYVVQASGAKPPGTSSGDLRSWLGRVEPDLFSLAGRSAQILDWYRSNQYCGRCGTPMEDHHNDRARQCPNCGYVAYPRLSPSIIVLVTRGDEMLLARNAAWPTGMFSTLAGFVEPGESIEQTVHREVKEEVGVDVTSLKYLGSQSWPFPNSLMLGFHAEYAGGELVLQDEEISEADWFTVDNLPQIPPPAAISRWLIDDFCAAVKARR